jgi:hypothetical protein
MRTHLMERSLSQFMRFDIVEVSMIAFGVVVIFLIAMVF